jgi:16S rRNA processing protein RimM
MITAPHGVRGLVRIRPFTETPEGVTAYGPVTAGPDGRALAIALRSFAKGQWLAAIDGVESREAADALRGQQLFVSRDQLPSAAEGEVYVTDLIGLVPRLVDGANFGRVVAVQDFGGGNLLEVEKPDRIRVFIPFTMAAVPELDVAAGRLVIDPPAGLFDPVEPDDRDPPSGKGGAR